MIRLKWDVNARLVDELRGYYDSFESVAREEFRGIWRQIEPVLLDELGDEPRQRVYPNDYPGGRLEWTSEKQRRWYWANVGHPYTRTGHLARNWRTSTQFNGGRVTIIVENPAPAAPFVYGSLAQANALRFQQRFHAITGWQPAKPTVDYWLDVAYREYEDALFARMGALVTGTTVKRRAFTRTPRRRRR